MPDRNNINRDPNFGKKYFWTFVLVGLIILIGRAKLGGGNTNSSNTIPSATSSPSSPSSSTSKYRNGTFTGTSADAYYGSLQIRVSVANGKISKVDILDYPHDNHTSQNINTQALPLLQKEVLQTQSNVVDAVSGASFTSQAFNQSLQSALSQAA